ncbi:MAG: translocation/assembly module TamB domain-containing protein [Muribaculaceae bacterium]|nr:translocation/assembly module TamB domain-containing protein [Muribaculaceae bacterium]
MKYRHIYNTLRFVALTVIIAVVAIFALSYLLLSTSPVQNKVRLAAEKAISDYIGTNVTIGKVDIRPFDQLTFHDLNVPDQQGDSMIAINRLGAGINIYELIRNKKIEVTYVELIGMNANLSRFDKNSPLNIQFIIDSLAPKGDEPPKPFDLRINNVVIRKCDISYDVLNEPLGQKGRFNSNHFHLADVRADVSLPKLKNEDFDIEVKRLSFSEENGFEVKNFVSHILVSPSQLDLKDIKLELPHSLIALEDITVRYSSLKDLGKELAQMEHELNISNSIVTPADFRSFLPVLENFEEPLSLTAAIKGNTTSLRVPVLQLNNEDNSFSLDLSGHAQRLNDTESFSFSLPHLSAKVTAAQLERITRHIHMGNSMKSVIGKLGNVTTDASASGSRRALNFNGLVKSALGAVSLNGQLNIEQKSYKGHIGSSDLLLGKLLNKESTLGSVALDANLTASQKGNKLHGSIDGLIGHIDYKGFRYQNITANVNVDGTEVRGKIDMDNSAGKLLAEGFASLKGSSSHIDMSIDAQDVNFSKLQFLPNMPDSRVTFSGNAALTGNHVENLTGAITVNDFSYQDIAGQNFKLDQVSLIANADGLERSFEIASDYVNGHIDGKFNYKSLIPSFMSMLAQTFPNAFAEVRRNQVSSRQNDIAFEFEVDPDEALQTFAKLPVRILYKSTIAGHLNESDGSFDLQVNAPYLLSGKSLIEETRLIASVDKDTHVLQVDAHTLLPSKNGKIAVDINAHGLNNEVNSNFSWMVKRDRDFHGNLDFTTKLGRRPDNSLDVDVAINPTTLIFNDTAWLVQPGHVNINKGVVSVTNLAGQCGKQFVRVNGQVSRDVDDVLCLDLNDVSLDYIFETLNIDNVMFGGRATGKFFASDLLTKSPRLSTPNLHVDGLAYNYAVMGDADIESQWLNEEKGVSIYAVLNQKNGEKSIIDGAIFVADDSLYLDMEAHRANVAFMKPFMSAFTSDVQGEVSGHAVLLGNFHTINAYGDVKADSLRFKLDYTNVVYTCAGDSVHMIPNLITFNGVRIHDRDGHGAKMSGWLRHDSFHRPVFNFSITQAKDLLCYDTNPNINPDWYGTIYGNGSAFVSGESGIVDIKVNMESAPRSRFTFVLSDAEEASEYTFITFHDRNKSQDTIPTDTMDAIPAVVRQLQAQVVSQQEEAPTHYNIELQGDITPDVQMVLVMDPVGGDQIKATGSGSMRMTYNDADEMTMFGKYTLEKGSYNFTLQDIIIKDFSIKDGSSISFQGDPYAATLDIEAVYALNANIRDLDESFANDREITRTNVPVHALLRAKGNISQPEVTFDLEFPTLTADAYRKVNSIISTDDMMNRQIIYLLALNRFYTPDYMNNTSRNNELTSVASSTISSQLSSILGKMSDKWSIAPNFRSDKGDFSDMEVDLALSSQLLNNRLLLNGNFGYRDNAFNTRNTNFIGDFDIEYLLNSRGTLRLKAYNHFNDQNYYVRNALTTQGVGIVWKHDFNHPFDFLKKKAPTTSTDSIKPDTTTVVKAPQ